MKSYLPLACLVVALVQPFAGALAPVLHFGTPIGTATRGLGAPEQPLPVFFSIWSLIFGAFLAFAVIFYRRREAWMARIAAPLTLAGLGNILWMLSAQLIVSQLVDFVLLAPIGIAAWLSAARFDRMRGMGGSPEKLVADAATGLLSGWILVAAAISVPLVIRGFTTLGATDLPWQMLWTSLGIAAFGAWMFARYVSRSLWFFAALAWGLLGIVANNWIGTGMGWLAIMTGVTGILVLALRIFRGADGSRIPA